MLSVDVLDHILPILELISDDQYLIVALRQMDEAHQEILSLLRNGLQADPNLAAQRHADTLKDINERISELRKMSVRRIITDANRLRDAIEGNWNQELPLSSARILRRVVSFEKHYERYVSNYYPVDAFTVFWAASELMTSILALRDALYDFASKLTLKTLEIDKKQVSEISIVFSSDSDLLDTARKLVALNNIYTEIACLFNVSTEEHPLLVRKIETGSLWTDLLGYPKIIDLMVRIIERVTDWCYHHFTYEGRIAVFPKQVEPIEKLLQLRAQLQEQGFDTTAMDHEISKAGAVITRNLYSLVAREPKIKINGAVHSVGNALEQKYLEEGRRLSLPSPDNGQDEDAS